MTVAEDPKPEQMLPLSGAPDELEIDKRSWRSGVHALVDDADRAYATLDFPAYVLGDVVGIAHEGWWTFRRAHGFIHTHRDITDGYGDVVTTVDLSALRVGGSLEIGGVGYEVSQQGYLLPSFTVSRGTETLFGVKRALVPLGHLKGTVHLTDAGRSDPAGSLLLLLAVDMMVAEIRRDHA